MRFLIKLGCNCNHTPYIFTPEKHMRRKLLSIRFCLISSQSLENVNNQRPTKSADSHLTYWSGFQIHMKSCCINKYCSLLHKNHPSLFCDYIPDYYWDRYEMVVHYCIKIIVNLVRLYA